MNRIGKHVTVILINGKQFEIEKTQFVYIGLYILKTIYFYVFNCKLHLLNNNIYTYSNSYLYIYVHTCIIKTRTKTVQ